MEKRCYRRRDQHTDCRFSPARSGDGDPASPEPAVAASTVGQKLDMAWVIDMTAFNDGWRMDGSQSNLARLLPKAEQRNGGFRLSARTLGLGADLARLRTVLHSTDNAQPQPIQPPPSPDVPTFVFVLGDSCIFSQDSAVKMKHVGTT